MALHDRFFPHAHFYKCPCCLGMTILAPLADGRTEAETKHFCKSCGQHWERSELVRIEADFGEPANWGEEPWPSSPTDPKLHMPR